MTGAEFVSRLQKVRGHGPHWMACCPAHEDRMPSLSINETTDRLLLKCHTGCPIESIVGALGLELADLYLEARAGKPDAPWGQAEADRALWLRGLRKDTLAYFHVSTEIGKRAWSFPLGKGRPTKFKAFSGSTGQKYWSTVGAKIGPYHLDPCAGQPEAWLVEGEPDVWIAHQAGLAAFSLTAGAKNLSPECVEAICRAKIGTVHIVYDNDDPGRDGARILAEALLAAGQTITVRILPATVGPHGDVTTFYNNLGGDDEKFREAMAALPQMAEMGHETAIGRGARVAELAAGSLDAPQQVASWGWRDVDRLVGGLIAGWSYAVGARVGNGKTSLLLNLLSRLRQDRVPTLYFGTEMAPEDLLKKWAAMECSLNELEVFKGAIGEGDRDRLKRKMSELMADGVVTFSTATRLDMARMGKEITWAFDARTGTAPRVIVLDHLHRLSQEREELDDLTKELKEIAQERRVAMLVACQLSREKDVGPLDLHSPPSLSRYKGSAAIEENADVALGLFRPLKRGTTPAQRRQMVQGQVPVSEHEEPNAMGVLCLKHRYNGSAMGRAAMLTVHGTRIESRAFMSPMSPMPPAPEERGDAFEETELDL